jgi:chromosomal replication initiator protein
MSDQLSFDGDYQDLWKRVRDELSTRLPRVKHTTFVVPLALEVLGPDRIALKGSNFVVEGLKHQGIVPLLQELFDEFAGRHILIEFVSVLVERSAAPAAVQVGREVSESPAPRETFENFVVGRTNELAFNAARRVALEPGERYNPLFIYGASGLGKTHLLLAIQNEVRRVHPTLVVRYMTAQEFSEEFISALQHGRIQPWRSKTRAVHVWLLDDIQFIAKRDKTQEEVFHAFNDLHREGRQIVIAADRPPRALYEMDERMRSRFEGGLLADIMPPETETRARILLAIAEREGIQLPTEVVEWMAAHGSTNVRSLIGAFHRVVAFANIRNCPIDVDLARSVLSSHFGGEEVESRRITGDRIIDACCEYFGVSRGALMGASRVKELVRARHVTMFLLREEAAESFAGIGLRFGRHHSSVLHAVEKVKAQMKTDAEFLNDLKCIRRELGLD